MVVCLYWEINIPQNFEKHSEALDENQGNALFLAPPHPPVPRFAQEPTLSQNGQSLMTLGNDCNDPKI